MKLKSYSEQIANRCRHFNGVMNDECDAKVKYADVRDTSSQGLAQLPCFKDGATHAVCREQSFLSDDEVGAQCAEHQENFKRLRICLEAARAHAKEKGLGKGRGGLGQLPCPSCKTGTLEYSVAAHNGHMHARCTTKGCVSWME